MKEHKIQFDLVCQLATVPFEWRLEVTGSWKSIVLAVSFTGLLTETIFTFLDKNGPYFLLLSCDSIVCSL